jgi:hypothetical protein
MLCAHGTGLVIAEFHQKFGSERYDNDGSLYRSSHVCAALQPTCAASESGAHHTLSEPVQCAVTMLLRGFRLRSWLHEEHRQVGYLPKHSSTLYHPLANLQVSAWCCMHGERPSGVRTLCARQAWTHILNDELFSHISHPIRTVVLWGLE